MTLTDQIKLIDNKTKGNQAQYDLDRLAAKSSALSSGKLRKYEYLIDEDLGYFSLGKAFNKELDDKDDKKEGLLNRIKNIEKNQSVNYNDKNKKTNDESELSSAESESRKEHRVVMINLKGVFIIQM